MKNSIEILIPADCLRSAGVVVAHERLAHAATHGLPQKIRSAIKSYLQEIETEGIAHLEDDVRLGDGEIVFTVTCKALDLQHTIDLAVLRTLIYAKLGMKERPAHVATPNSDAREHCEPTHVEDVGVDVHPDALEATATIGLTSSTPPNAMLPTEDTSSAPAQGELIAGFTHDRNSCPDDSVSGTNPAPSGGNEDLPESTVAPVEIYGPARTPSPREAVAFDPPVADRQNQLMKIKDADLEVGGDENLPELAGSESRESDGDLNPEFHQVRPVPELILENPIVEEEVEVIEMCSNVVVVTLRGADASEVVVLDPTVAATIAPRMNLADRLAGAPRKCGGLWELRSFRLERDASDE